jgi:hypothetical protein
MESFWRRLKYYGIGFGIGLILTFGFFNTRGCSWMPSNRVKEAMNASIWIMESKSQKVFFNKHHFNKSSFYNAIQDADVAFTESKRHGNHKIYQLEIKNHKGKSILLLALMTDESALIEFVPTQQKWQEFIHSKQHAFLGNLLYTPKQKNFFYIPENSALQQAFAHIGVQNNEQLNHQLKKAQFSYRDSYLKATPKPLLAFEFTPANRRHDAQKAGSHTVYCIWYKDKLKVLELK